MLVPGATILSMRLCGGHGAQRHRQRRLGKPLPSLGSSAERRRRFNLRAEAAGSLGEIAIGGDHGHPAFSEPTIKTANNLLVGRVGTRLWHGSPGRAINTLAKLPRPILRSISVARAEPC